MYMRITMADGGTRCFDQKNKKDNKNNKNNKNNQVNIKSRSAEAKTSAGRDFDYRYFRSAAFCSGIRRETAFQVSSILLRNPPRDCISGQQHIQDRSRQNAEQGVPPQYLQYDHTG